MFFFALAQDLPKSRITCCCGTEEPSRSHGVRARASVSNLSSWVGPQVGFSPVALLCAWLALDLATDPFQIRRHRPHSPSRISRGKVVVRGLAGGVQLLEQGWSW